MSDDLQEQDCAVCLQKCHHPTQLPCGHIFCFLCVKGIAIQNKRCAMCRAEIPRNYLDNPILLEKLSEHPNEVQVDYQWYYEGRNGWWKYDERSNIELEAAFNERGGECTLLLAGALYCIDFENMTQAKCNDSTKRRRVRRDTPMFPAKGIAGIKVEKLNSNRQQPTKSGDDDISNTNMTQSLPVMPNSIDDSDDDDVQIVEVEPVIIDVDEINDDFDRLSIT